MLAESFLFFKRGQKREPCPRRSAVYMRRRDETFHRGEGNSSRKRTADEATPGAFLAGEGGGAVGNLRESTRQGTVVAGTAVEEDHRMIVKAWGGRGKSLPKRESEV